MLKKMCVFLFFLLSRLNSRTFCARILPSCAGTTFSWCLARSRSSTWPPGIDPTPASLDAFLNQLPEDRFYVSREAARAALNQSGMFNVIEFDGGWKADLIVPRRRPFSRSEFARRSSWEVDGRTVDVVTAEDLVLAKLEWARDSGSDRQLEDAAAILRVRRDELDHAYLELWVAELGVTEQWVAVQ